MGTGNYSSTSNNMKLVHWVLMGALLHLVQRGGDWAGPQPAQIPPRCTKVTAHPSTASVPITVLLYNSPLSCGFNASIKGLTWVGGVTPEYPWDCLSRDHFPFSQAR